MKPITFLTAGEASRATGKSIPTITRNVKNGKIANSRLGDDGEYEIDPTALFNRYPAIDPALGGKSNETPKKLVSETPKNDAGLQAVIDALKLVIEEKDKAVARAEENAEQWRTEFKSTQNQLTDQRTEETSNQKAPPHTQGKAFRW